MEEGEEREKTRFVSCHFPKDFPGLLLCLEKDGPSLQPKGREGGCLGKDDDGTWETRLPPRACSSSNTVTCSSFESQLLSPSPVCG